VKSTCESRATRRTPRRPAAPAAGPSTAGTVGRAPEEEAAGRSLVLVQGGRVVCVVEDHRREAARSVAHLLCRLLMSETYVYACSPQEAAALSADSPLPLVPQSWNELYRAIPWEDAAVGFR
jgi:hypothetical protein